MNVSPPLSLSATTRDVQCEKVPPLHDVVPVGSQSTKRPLLLLHCCIL